MLNFYKIDTIIFINCIFKVRIMKHSIRQAKITLYLDIPTIDDKNHFIGNNGIVSLCEDAISKIPNFRVNAPSDIIAKNH